MGPTTSKFIKKYVGCEKKCECGGEDAGPPSPPPLPDATCLVLHNRSDFSSTCHDDHTVQSNYVMPLNTLANFRQCANVRCIYQKKKKTKLICIFITDKDSKCK